MLLGWIDELGLIKSDPRKNIIKNFPLEVKRVVISSIVEYFNNQNDSAKNNLTTTAHVEWVMEVIGQAFSMPIVDHVSIDRAINVYTKWLFEVDQRPFPMQENLQYFIQQIFNHFSLLFEERGENSSSNVEERKQHIYLCNRVLDIFLQMGVKGDMLEEDTWNHILKVILGVTDSTLRGKRGIQELNYGLLKVLFELWLCSLSDDKVMWNHLQEHGILWSKNNATINQWNSVCIGLTNRVINLLYGPSEGTSVVRIQWEGLNPKNNPNPNVGNPTTELDLPDEYVYYAWNQFLHVIGNPNKLVDPEIHLKAFQGIEVITHSLAYVGTDPPIKKLKEQKIDFRIPYAPNANSILDIFGPWYFESVFRDSPYYNQGRAVAFSALCKIFCRKGGGPISKQYLSLFYKSIIQGLGDDDPIVVIAILLGSKKIFSYEELEGSHILIPHYMKVCDRILGGATGPTTTPTNSTTKEAISNSGSQKYNNEVRNACITIVSSLICFSNHFATQRELEGELNSQACLYKELKFQIQGVFQKALKSEKNPKNLQQIIWAVVVLIFEEIDYNPEIGVIFIRNLMDLVKNFASRPLKEYPAEVFITIYEALSSLTSLYNQMIEAEPLLAREVVYQLSTIIPLQVALLKQNQTTAKLIEETFYSLCDWLMCGSYVILNNKESITKIVFAIDQGLNITKGASSMTAITNNNTSSPSSPTTSSQSGGISDLEAIKTSAEFVLSHMMNHISHFPTTSDNAAIVSTLTEDTECLDDLEPENSNYVRFYIYDNHALISLVEQPNEKSGPGVTMICRDVTGKYSWDSRALYGEIPQPYTQLEERGIYTGSTSDGLLGHTPEPEQNEVLMQHSIKRDIKSRDGIDLFMDMIDIQEEAEYAFIEETQEFYEDLDVSCNEPSMRYKYGGDCKASMSRLLLSTMGLLNIGLTNRFVPLQSNAKLLRSLRNIDGTQPRETHKIGVVYVKEGQDDQQDLFVNQGGSEEYSKFLRSLGWDVSLEQHLGFMGGLDKNGSTGVQAPYFADYKTEVMFHVPTMMPNNPKDPQQIHKKRHVGNDHVNIIWSEHTRDYYRNTIISQFNFVHIVLYPLVKSMHGLLRVDVMVKDRSYPVFGPVLDGMILSEKIVGSLIRQTAVNGSRISRAKSTGITRPYIQRKLLIQELATRYKTSLETDKYFASLFLSKEHSNLMIEPPSKKLKTKEATSSPTTTQKK
ncbi:hypothetical protein ABK040_013888 [Willaertia magna]